MLEMRGRVQRGLRSRTGDPEIMLQTFFDACTAVYEDVGWNESLLFQRTPVKAVVNESQIVSMQSTNNTVMCP
jgi:hypothetical protein